MVEAQSLGRYRIERELGRGASGIVYQALDTSLERQVALKAVSTAGLDGHEKQDLLARFKREATAAARLAHPNIVTIYDFGHESDTAFIVMELIAGSSLATEISARERLDFERILALMKQLLAGLQAAHAHGVVHRDIKPSNLLLLPDGHLKIADFGVARLESSTVTRAGTILGTPSYMAPEQLAGQTVDRRADLFSAGVILYELLAGRRPFVGDSTYSVIYQVLHADPPLPSQLDLPVPKWIDNVVRQALAKDPAERFQDAQAFATALDDAAQTLHGGTATTLRLDALPGTAAGPLAAPTGQSRARHSARRPWWGAAALAGVAALLAWGWWFTGETEKPAREPTGAVAGLPVPATQTPALAQAATTALQRGTESAATPAPKSTPEVAVTTAKPREETVATAPKTDKRERAPLTLRSTPSRTAPPPALPAGDVAEAPGDWGKESALPPREIALGLLRRAAERGDVRAMNRLGNLLKEGRGVEQDLLQAAQWFEKAVAGGNLHATVALAGMYREGQGVPRNTDKAVQLYQKAASAGHPRALVQLGILHFKGEDVPQNDEQAVSYFRQAALKGDPGAMVYLAYMHEIGRTVPRDQAEALRLYRRAAELGEPRARERLRQLGEAVPNALPQARRFSEARRPLGLAGEGAFERALPQDRLSGRAANPSSR